MDIKRITGAVDHTLLDVDSIWEDIAAALDDAIRYETASACIPPCYIARAREYVGDSLRLCTVAGFPNGYQAAAVKAFEAGAAVRDGADEIDMVINIGWLKDGLYDNILGEIAEVRKACEGKILKVIIETCLLSDAEKLKMCDIVSRSGADFIKTSTGFSKGGATLRDIALIAANIGSEVKIKASGGISSLEDAEKLLDAGASRLGTSRIINIIKNRHSEGY